MVDEYILTNFLYFVLFNTDGFNATLEGKYDRLVLKESFIEALRSLVEYMFRNDYLDEKIKDRISRLMNYVRFKGANPSQMNDIIGMLNSGKGDKVLDFYQNQISAQLLLEKGNVTIYEGDISRTMEIISNNVFFISSSHSLYSDEEFEQIISEFVEDERYLDTITYICMFQEPIFTSPNFLTRVRKVIKLKQESKSKFERQKMKTFGKILNNFE